MHNPHLFPTESPLPGLQYRRNRPTKSARLNDEIGDFVKSYRAFRFMRNGQQVPPKRYPTRKRLSPEEDNLIKVSHVILFKSLLQGPLDRKGPWFIYMRERNLCFQTYHFNIRVSWYIPNTPAATVNLKLKVKVLVPSL